MTRAEFAVKFNTVYHYLLRNNKALLDKHLPKINQTRSFDAIKKELESYKYFKDARKTSAYGYAYRLGWLDKMNLSCIKNNNFRKNVLCLETKKIYKSSQNASNSLGLSREAVRQAILKGTKSGGFHWEYCDENGKVLDKPKKK